MKLHAFLTSNRQQIISRCREKVATRCEPIDGSTSSIDHGVPLFLEQLVETLRQEQNTHIRVGDAAPTPAPTDIGRAAALHGDELLRRGFSVDQVVHEYGDVCQCVTALAVAKNVPISTDEFRTLNRCLDNAIADAVAAFGAIHQTAAAAHAKNGQERLDVFAAENRRLIDIAEQSFDAIKTGNIGASGATGSLLEHTLRELRSLADRSLAEIELESRSVTPGPK